MRDLRIRCSSIGKIMTDPKLKSEVLSVGAKTHIRELAAQEILGVEFEVSSKPMEKGIQCEDAAIELVSGITGRPLSKNTERRQNDYITGECDIFDEPLREGRDIKCSWSASTFPITVEDCADKGYEWQMRGYMALWNAERWHVDYCLLDTPESLIGFEPLPMHIVSHIPAHMRVTTWTVTRDLALEAAIAEKVKHARAYYAQVVAEFDKTHQPPLQGDPGDDTTPPLPDLRADEAAAVKAQALELQRKLDAQVKKEVHGLGAALAYHALQRKLDAQAKKEAAELEAQRAESERLEALAKQRRKAEADAMAADAVGIVAAPGQYPAPPLPDLRADEGADMGAPVAPGTPDMRNWVQLAFRALNDAAAVLESIVPGSPEEGENLTDLTRRIKGLASHFPALLQGYWLAVR